MSQQEKLSPQACLDALIGTAKSGASLWVASQAGGASMGSDVMKGIESIDLLNNAQKATNACAPLVDDFAKDYGSNLNEAMQTRPWLADPIY